MKIQKNCFKKNCLGPKTIFLSKLPGLKIENPEKLFGQKNCFWHLKGYTPESKYSCRPSQKSGKCGTWSKSLMFNNGNEVEFRENPQKLSISIGKQSEISILDFLDYFVDISGNSENSQIFLSFSWNFIGFLLLPWRVFRGNSASGKTYVLPMVF